jgi:hypothetical protein
VAGYTEILTLLCVPAGGRASRHVLDGGGWHVSHDLVVPPSITPVVLPPCSPELNPVERVRLYLRERFLSLRLLYSTDAIIAPVATPDAPRRWNRPDQVALHLSVDREGRVIDSAVQGIAEPLQAA